MRVVKDLLGGGKPNALDIWYNGDLAADSTTKRYAGSLVKMMDYDDIDHGKFFTFAGLTTAMENIAGILEEEQPTSDNYLPDATTYGVRRRRMTPVFPSTIIEAEYGQTDLAGTANTVASATGSASSTSIAATITTADVLIGGWVYVVSGAASGLTGFLSYITNNTTSAITIKTALPAALVATDTLLIILPPCVNKAGPDATYSGFKSFYDDASWTLPIVGLNTFIKAPGIPKQYLDREKHDGLVISGAKFYHHFTYPGNSTYPNIWNYNIKLS